MNLLKNIKKQIFILSGEDRDYPQRVIRYMNSQTINKVHLINPCLTSSLENSLRKKFPKINFIRKRSMPWIEDGTIDMFYSKHNYMYSCIYDASYKYKLNRKIKIKSIDFLNYYREESSSVMGNSVFCSALGGAPFFCLEPFLTAHATEKNKTEFVSIHFKFNFFPERKLNFF